MRKKFTYEFVIIHLVAIDLIEEGAQLAKVNGSAVVL